MLVRRARRQRQGAVVALVLATASVTASAQAPAPSTASFPSDAAVLALLRARVGLGHNPGIVVGLLEPGRRRVLAYGSSGRADSVLDGRTLFEIGSITKVFTGTLLADMARRGELSLDDPVARYLPASVRVPSRGARRITLLDLSTQHSGLPRLPDNMHPRDPENPYADYPVDSMFAFLSRYELAREPGVRFEYSNLGVGLLGEALARRAGTTYEALVRQRILDPLGMSDTRVVLSPDQRRRLARGHDPSGAFAKNWDVPALAGAGALRSTADDLLRFAGAALGTNAPPEVRDALADAEQPRKALGDHGAMAIGLNWFTQHGPVEIVWHNGGTGGYRSFIGLDRASRRAVVVLTNSAQGADDIGRHLLDPSIPLTP